jgi:hypothetical protein
MLHQRIEAKFGQQPVHQLPFERHVVDLLVPHKGNGSSAEYHRIGFQDIDELLCIRMASGSGYGETTPLGAHFIEYAEGTGGNRPVVVQQRFVQIRHHPLWKFHVHTSGLLQHAPMKRMTQDALLTSCICSVQYSKRRRRLWQVSKRPW